MKSSCLSEIKELHNQSLFTRDSILKQTEELHLSFCESSLTGLASVVLESFLCYQHAKIFVSCMHFLSRERERERRRSRERSPQRKRSRERSPRRERERSPRRPRRVVPRYTVQFSKFSLDWYVYSARCLPTSHFIVGTDYCEPRQRTCV